MNKFCLNKAMSFFYANQSDYKHKKYQEKQDKNSHGFLSPQYQLSVIFDLFSLIFGINTQ
jgi:hypothetical protein